MARARPPRKGQALRACPWARDEPVVESPRASTGAWSRPSASPPPHKLTRQVFFEPAAQPPYTSCREGLLELHRAVDRARLAAAGTDGENEALARFRSALMPEWGYRDGVAAQCQGKKTEEGALDAIERLRYAEEHAVRREAGELAPLRRRVQVIVDRELSPKAPP
jgi:hypothetical protein